MAVAMTWSCDAQSGDWGTVLNPVVVNPIGNDLGPSALNDAADYFNVTASKWHLPTVAPEYDNNQSRIPNNLSKLVPAQLLVVPGALTVRTSQFQGGLADDGRRSADNGIPRHVTTRPAGDSVFVYAFNAKQQLIYPLARSVTGTGFIATYELLSFSNHSNKGLNSQPIVVATDVDEAAGGATPYDPNAPTSNPPWALMTRARLPGNYHIHLVGRLNGALVPVDSPESAQLGAVAHGDFEVLAVDGPELIDQLVLRGTATKASCTGTPRKPCLSLQQGESITISAVGRQFIKVWDDASKAYVTTGYRDLSLNRVVWSYKDDPLLKPSDPTAGKVALTTPSAGGAVVTLIGINLGKGQLTIEGQGRSFLLDVFVAK